MPKSYDIADAGALFALSDPNTSDDALKAMLIEASDVPVERIDDCFAELKASGIITDLRLMATLQGMAFGKAPTVTEMRAVFQGASWTDDNEGHTTFKTKVLNEDETVAAEITVTKTY